MVPHKPIKLHLSGEEERWVREDWRKDVTLEGDG